MIRLHRDIDAPAVLKEDGLRQTERDCLAYDAAPQKYISSTGSSPTRSFKSRPYYRSDDVKDALVRMNHNKCCYCEAKPGGVSYFHVDHFRPKGAFKQHRGDNNEYPGYYWLAYCWENLMLACQKCNMEKGALFPLEDISQRARSHHNDLTKEYALFVNPAEEDPRDHIRFQEDLPVYQSERGRHTIEGVDLRRIELREDRLLHLEPIMIMIDMLKRNEGTPSQDDQDLDEMRNYIKEAMEPNAQFSSMVIDLVAHRGLLVDDIEQMGD